MKEALLDFPNQFHRGYNLVHQQLHATPMHVSQVLVVGMGGSALPGDLLKLYLRSDLPVEVNRDYRTHTVITPHTLIFACSYSGNTEETIENIQQLSEMSSNIIVICAGGKLAQWAKEKSLPLIILPADGIQPRAATGYFFSIMISILEHFEAIQPRKEEVIAMANGLSARMDHPYLQKVAERMKGLVPYVYASDDFLPVVRNIKIKFNENSKTPACFNVFPELNHNEMVGFTTLTLKPFFLLFQKSFDHERTIKRMQIFADIMREKGCDMENIQLKGATILETMLEASHIGDWLSYYLAVANGIDPEPVVMVEDFKKRIA